MELPTYTNIWKIEKRLYKLYDFRLPMPLPVSQVAAFLAIAIPYTLMLTLVGMPFSHTWLWLYVLPPAVLAWLVTRPVLEGKRLPELALSQLRYLTEPRTWCRLAPLAERDEIILVARVWRHAAPVPVAEADLDAAATSAAPEATWVRPAWPDEPAVRRRGRAPGAPTAPAVGTPGDAPKPDDTSRQSVRERSGPAQRPLTVHAGALAERPIRMVERALRAHADGLAGGWHDRVVVVPGGHRPGKPDQVQRDQARARVPLAGPARIVILGTTGGAGQTITTLLAGQVLASLRGEAVAVLDLGSGPGGLTRQARAVPRLLPSRRISGRTAADQADASRERGLQVVTAESGTESQDAGELIEAVVARYPLTLADAAAVHVPRALNAADQLVLVAPAGANAVGSLALMLEWLEAHGHDRLARTAVIVLNGVSEETAEHAERAGAAVAGRCRAVVRVPWEAGLASGTPLGAASVRAYTALAGVLVSALADQARADSRPAGRVPG